MAIWPRRVTSIFARSYLSLSSHLVSNRLSTMTTPVTKPPNILILSKVKRDHDSSSYFESSKSIIQSCLGKNRYTVYPLELESDLLNQPWKDNCSLLIIPPTTFTPLTDEAIKTILSYIRGGGKCLCINHQFNDYFCSGDINLSAPCDGLVQVVPRYDSELPSFYTTSITSKQTNDILEDTSSTHNTTLTSNKETVLTANGASNDTLGKDRLTTACITIHKETGYESTGLTNHPYPTTNDLSPTSDLSTKHPTTSDLSTKHPTTSDLYTKHATSDLSTKHPTTSDLSTKHATSDLSAKHATSDLSTKHATSDLFTKHVTSDLSTNHPTTSDLSTKHATSDLSTNHSTTSDAILSGPIVTTLATCTNTSSSTIPPLSCVVGLSWSDNTEGVIINSTVHLLDPMMHSHTGDNMANVMKIKETGQEMQEFLTSLFNRLGLIGEEAMEVSELSFVYLFTKNESLKDKLISTLQSSKVVSKEKEKEEEGFIIVGNETSCLFITDDYTIGTPVDPPVKSNEKQVTIITKPSSYQLNDINFNSSLYFKNLKSTSLGRCLLVGPVMTSSQTLFTGNIPLTNILTNELGVVCCPGQQTKGKGRGGNVWLSPKGCMMFSCPVKFPEGSRLSKRASIVQHIATLSVVSAIRTQTGYEDVPINIKWPNDIYYNSSVKLGGCLVNAYTINGATTVIIGLGVNVSNHYPTLSINDCIAIYNSQNGTELAPFHQEALLGLSLSKLEMYLSLFNQWGLTAIEDIYYQYWMHHNATVELSGYSVDSAVIIGINEYGYLRVRTPSNQVLSLGPDGNTFDIMKGLICMK